MGIRETLANIQNTCARRSGENHMLKRSRPQSVSILQISEKNVRVAEARATFWKWVPLNP
eukprot:7521865-Pyramimonas_sp.AAC.1